ncbi:hypothetical protein [Massilia alkalitolerans]|uniref:hypothetical protein n=1 Tax=Massilia alkalitolerans TaxID=286638 RepID=UPI0028ABE03B|nr:hypothetical protein [Massilia alkalitolerans]
MVVLLIENVVKAACCVSFDDFKPLQYWAEAAINVANKMIATFFLPPQQLRPVF